MGPHKLRKDQNPSTMKSKIGSVQILNI